MGRESSARSATIKSIPYCMIGLSPVCVHPRLYSIEQAKTKTSNSSLLCCCAQSLCHMYTGCPNYCLVPLPTVINRSVHTEQQGLPGCSDLLIATSWGWVEAIIEAVFAFACYIVSVIVEDLKSPSAPIPEGFFVGHIRHREILYLHVVQSNQKCYPSVHRPLGRFSAFETAQRNSCSGKITWFEVMNDRSGCTGQILVSRPLDCSSNTRSTWMHPP